MCRILTLAENRICQEHGRDDSHGVGFVEVRRHTGAITHIIAYVVGNDSRVARIVFRNTGFDLAYQVRADIRRLRIDAARDTGEHAHERAAEPEPDERMKCMFRRNRFGQVENPETPMSPRPTTMRPVTEPPLNATPSAFASPLLAASAVRTLVRTVTIMPI
jgi:hypothetical protein